MFSVKVHAGGEGLRTGALDSFRGGSAERKGDVQKICLMKAAYFQGYLDFWGS